MTDHRAPDRLIVRWLYHRENETRGLRTEFDKAQPRTTTPRYSSEFAPMDSPLPTV
jgi:hypothetical protein